MNERWESLWMDQSGDVWGYPYATGPDGRPGYLGLGFIDDPWSRDQIEQRGGGPLIELRPVTT